MKRAWITRRKKLETPTAETPVVLQTEPLEQALVETTPVETISPRQVATDIVKASNVIEIIEAASKLGVKELTYKDPSKNIDVSVRFAN